MTPALPRSLRATGARHARPVAALAARWPLTADERFWDSVEKRGDDLCWIWKRNQSHRYGRIKIEQKQWVAHRYAYESLIGPVPDGLELDHLCGNPKCVNPAHLEPVSHATNIDRGRKGKGKVKSCPRGHPYVQSNTRYTKRGSPLCLECERDRGRERHRQQPRSEWPTWQRRARRHLVARAGGRCEIEGCTRADGLHAHHVAGRGRIVSEPLASHPALLSLLCDVHHRALHATPGGELEVSVLRTACDRVRETWGVSATEFRCRSDYMGLFRSLERTLRANGWDAIQHLPGRIRKGPEPNPEQRQRRAEASRRYRARRQALLVEAGL